MDRDKYSVAICMSTYNGEKYIKKQIESLLKQTYKNIDIYVRDDGSRDNTLKILKEYEKNTKVKIITGKNLGVVKSFYECLKQAYNAKKYDFFAYCDQDDVWHKDKIQKAIVLLSKQEQNIPLLYFSEFNYCDENLKITQKSNLNKIGASFRNSLLECISFGIVEVFNNSLAKEIINSTAKDVCYHDWWAYMIASGIGKTLYDDSATVKYRRTGQNVSPSGKTGFSLFIYRIKKFLLNGYFPKVRKQIQRYKDLYSNSLDKENLKVINLFCSKYNFLKAIRKVFYPHRFRQNIKDEIFCRILFLFGML